MRDNPSWTWNLGGGRRIRVYREPVYETGRYRPEFSALYTAMLNDFHGEVDREEFSFSGGFFEDYETEGLAVHDYVGRLSWMDGRSSRYRPDVASAWSRVAGTFEVGVEKGEGGVPYRYQHPRALRASRQVVEEPPSPAEKLRRKVEVPEVAEDADDIRKRAALKGLIGPWEALEHLSGCTAGDAVSVEVLSGAAQELRRIAHLVGGPGALPSDARNLADALEDYLQHPHRVGFSAARGLAKKLAREYAGDEANRRAVEAWAEAALQGADDRLRDRYGVEMEVAAVASCGDYYATAEGGRHGPEASTDDPGEPKGYFEAESEAGGDDTGSGEEIGLGNLIDGVKHAVEKEHPNVLEAGDVEAAVYEELDVTEGHRTAHQYVMWNSGAVSARVFFRPEIPLKIANRGFTTLGKVRVEIVSDSSGTPSVAQAIDLIDDIEAVLPGKRPVLVIGGTTWARPSGGKPYANFNDAFGGFAGGHDRDDRLDELRGTIAQDAESRYGNSDLYKIVDTSEYD